MESIEPRVLLPQSPQNPLNIRYTTLTKENFLETTMEVSDG